MEINVYNYTCTTKVGSLRALECTLTQTVGEYSTVAITIDRYDYTDRCKTFCLLNNHILAQDGEYYAIRRIDEYEKTVKIECTHYAVNLSNIYCIVWNHKTIDEWFLTGLVSQINRALTGQNTYMVLDNVSNVPFSSTLHIDISGLVLQSTLNTPVYDVDFFGMTLSEILAWICDALNLKVFYVGDTIYLSNLLDKFTEEKLSGRSGRLVFKDGLQCRDLEIIQSLANYKAAVRPFCVIDRNDRLQKEQYTYIGAYKYNEEYRTSHIEADCRKLAEVHTFKTPFEWDRRIKSNINLYDKWHQTDTEFNRRRFKCTVNYEYDKFQSGVGDVTICNVIGEEIGTATVPTSGSANIYNFEGTAIGYCDVTRVTTTEEDNWVVHYYIHCNYFGIWSSAYGDVDLYIDGGKTELDIYDCVHNKIGVVSLSGTREGNYVLNYI